MKKVLPLLIGIAFTILTATVNADTGDIQVIAKIVPYNNSFTGLMDAKQIIGGLNNTIPPTAISTSDVWQYLNATGPLTFDATSGIFSMPKASATQSGYLSKEDYQTFSAGINPSYLKLDQSTPQTITGGAPTFNAGLSAVGTISATYFNGDGSSITNINGSHITSNTITSNTLADGAVTNSKLGANAVTGDKLANNISIATTGSITAGSMEITGNARFDGKVINSITSITPTSSTINLASYSSYYYIYKIDGSSTSVINYITGGENGQTIILRVSDDDKLVKITASTNPATENIKLSGGVTFTLGKGDALALNYDSSDGFWYELYRADN